MKADNLTLAAIAILAMCVATAAHEAVGHGGACLALGGHITQLTSVYFQCAAANPWIAAGGPIGNLVCAALAYILSLALAPAGARMRLFAFLIAAFSLFWFSGYLLYSAALNDGDLYFFARDTLGQITPLYRILGAVLAIALYALGFRMIRGFVARFSVDASLSRHALRASWVAASLAACAATLAYAPDRFTAMGQAALEIGVASLPLVIGRALHATPQTAETPMLTRSWPWIALAAIGYAAFIATLGHGITL